MEESHKADASVRPHGLRRYGPDAGLNRIKLTARPAAVVCNLEQTYTSCGLILLLRCFWLAHHG